MKFAHRRRFLQVAAGAVALPAVSRFAKAQSYPARPINFVVPFAAGGPTDAVARIMADHMRGSLGQPVLIENVAGAAGSIGVGRAARAVSDGYTVSFGNWTTHVINGAIYDLQYDLLRDLDPVALLPSNPQLIVSRKSVPANNLNELITWLKVNQDKVSAGTAGVGSAGHIGGIYFQKITGTRFPFIPYRGTGPAMTDLIAGQIDLMVDQVSNSLPHVRSGAIKAYGVTASTRLLSAPDIPTVDEAGAPGLYISVWYGLWVPKATSREVIAKLSSAATTAMADPAVRRRMADLGLDVPPPDQQTAAALGELQRAEVEKWWPIIKASKIRGE